MRIGTWNLAGHWSEAHRRLLIDQECDVWLLTELSELLELHGYFKHHTAACMAPSRRWAGILSREPLVRHDDPHSASALARVGELTFCSSILPWRSCGDGHPWTGTDFAEKAKATLDDLLRKLPTEGLVWGGDWNQALSGRDWVGSLAGRKQIMAALQFLSLQVPTSLLEHRVPEQCTIDHIAVPIGRKVISANRIVAAIDGTRLSDHDAYVVEIA